ncbi:MAG TPA: ribonuclease R [Acidiferrobacterales bacterium]|nr:ribonuclease R [Acidiferrobacterales bacterium]
MSTQKPNKPDKTQSETPADPKAARAPRTYEFPVPSREAVLAILKERGEPLTFKAITDALHVEGERDLDAFGRRLRAMERDGQLLKNRRGLYALIDRMDMVTGRVIGHHEGFGFLVPDQGGDDLFLSPREMRLVLHGDRAVARVAGLDQRGRKEGSIIEVLERAHKTVVGRYVAENNVNILVPSDKRITQDILIPHDAIGVAKPNQIVVAEIIEHPTRRSQPVGRIVEVLGDHMAPGMEIEVAIRAYDLPHVWPDAVQSEVSSLAPQVPEEAKENREDLRTVPLVTIDGEDARDFDDAVYCERIGKSYRLIVAIADVSHYVRPGTALDREGQNRGNSVYFPNNVIPMLPEILSNGLCSLNPLVDRLCMACEMEIDAHGEIQDFRFFEALMRSQARLTYTKVAAMLVDQDAALRKEYAPLVPHLENLYALYKILNKARHARGAVDFELPETKIIYNAQRKIERIVPLQRNDAHKLIEECMLAANVCAAEFLVKKKVPAPFRIHAGPPVEKLTALREFLFELGVQLGGGDEPKAKDYAKLLASLGERPDVRLIHTVLLRSLSQAIYSPDNIGHFALGFENYTHFTSPIRRYPDLLVHRAIKGILKRQPIQDTIEAVQTLTDHLSSTERRADDATREVTRWLKAEYMMDKIGEEFDGIISGVTNFGIFVELAEVYVDGLVHITSLGNDYYHFDPAKHRLLGERTNRSYRLGDSVRVKVAQVNLDEAKLDFELVGEAKREARRAPKRESKHQGKRREPKRGPRKK